MAGRPGEPIAGRRSHRPRCGPVRAAGQAALKVAQSQVGRLGGGHPTRPRSLRWPGRPPSSRPAAITSGQGSGPDRDQVRTGIASGQGQVADTNDVRCRRPLGGRSFEPPVLGWRAVPPSARRPVLRAADPRWPVLGWPVHLPTWPAPLAWRQRLGPRDWSIQSRSGWAARRRARRGAWTAVNYSVYR